MISAGTPPTPWAIDMLNAQWLTAILLSAGLLAPSAAVEGFTVEPIGEGIGLLGSLARLRLRYSSAQISAPRSLVVKFSTPNMENRAVAKAFNVYAREVGFYRDIAPAIQGIGPRCYAAEYDGQTGLSLLLLEDLENYRPGDQVKGCDRAEAELIIDMIAPLHARFWGRASDPALGWAPRIDGDMQMEGFARGCSAGWDACMARFGHVIDREIWSHRDMFIAAMPALTRRMAKPVQTLVHGDLRLDNIMFGTHPADRPVVAIDWIVTFSAAIHDLAYLLTQNMDIQVRRNNERALVNYYHSRLLQHGVTRYSIDDMWEDYKAASLYMFSYGVVIAGGLEPTNSRARTMMEKLMARASASIMDHKLLENLRS